MRFTDNSQNILLTAGSLLPNILRIVEVSGPKVNRFLWVFCTKTATFLCSFLTVSLQFPYKKPWFYPGFLGLVG